MSIIAQTASGYAGIYGTPLARIEYADTIIARWYAEDYLPEITNTRIAERITSCTQEINFLRAPTGGEWRSYQENQAMVPSMVSITAECVRVGILAYNALKFDENTIRTACERWDEFEKHFMVDMYQKLVKMLREWVLTGMIAETSPANKGANAGKYGNISLGTVDNPVVINKDNIPVKLALLQQVFYDSMAWRENEMFVVMPTQLMPVLVTSNYANAMWVGSCVSCSQSITGMLSHQLVGFNVILTTEVIGRRNAAGQPFFFIIAGHREAFAFAADILAARLVTDPYTFGIQYQVLAGWGGKALYPQALAVMVASFSYDG